MNSFRLPVTITDRREQLGRKSSGVLTPLGPGAVPCTQTTAVLRGAGEEIEVQLSVNTLSDQFGDFLKLGGSYMLILVAGEGDEQQEATEDDVLALSSKDILAGASIAGKRRDRAA